MADRIPTTHAGSLPRPDDLVDMIWARMDGQQVDEGELESRIEGAVAEVVAKQREAGIDLISDGEMSKTGFSTYINERFSGFAGRSEFQADDVAEGLRVPHDIEARHLRPALVGGPEGS